MLNLYKLYFTFFLFFTSLSFKAQDTLNNNKTWLRFNVQGSFIANTSFSNLEFPYLYPEKAGNDLNYTKNPDKPICFGFNIGFEFLIGRRDKFKQIVGSTYDLTNSSYTNYFSYTGWHTTPSEKQHLDINRQVQFFNVNYGCLFGITSKLKISAIASLAFCTITKDIANGYLVESSPSVMGNPSYYDSTLYRNSKTTDSGLNFIGALKLRASYDINKYISVFVLRNLGFNYKAPWWMLGVQYYPFKKWR